MWYVWYDSWLDLSPDVPHNTSLMWAWLIAWLIHMLFEQSHVRPVLPRHKILSKSFLSMFTSSLEWMQMVEWLLVGWAGYCYILLVLYIALVHLMYFWVISVMITCWGEELVCGQELYVDTAGFYWQSVVVMLGRRASSGKIHWRLMIAWGLAACL